MYDQRFQATLVHTEGIPRSHCYPTSDGSEAGSPRGGGSAGSGVSISPPLSHPQTQQHERSQEDTPFHPSRTTVRRGFALPPEHPFPSPFYSATPGFGGDTQFGGHVGQLHDIPTPIIGLEPPQQGFASFPRSSQHHPHSHHSHHHQHRDETSASSSSLSSTQSSRFGSPTVSVYGTSFPDTGGYLRHQLGLPVGTPVNLDCLPDPPPGRKPSQPYPILIKLAIYGSPNKKLTLKGIYEAIENRFEYFKSERTGAWKRSIRHNLSLNRVFRNTARPITEPGKGSYWELDISQGEGYKRARKRRNKKSQRRQRTQGQESESESTPSADDEEYSDASSLRRSESPSGRSRTAEMGNTGLGPFRTVHGGPMARRSSPYPQSNPMQIRAPAPVQAYTAESSRGTPPQAWAGPGTMGQVLQGQYHQPQPQPQPQQYPFAPSPLSADNQSLHTMFSSMPIANTMAWHAQMRYPERSASASSPFPYVSNLSSSMSGHGQLGGPLLQHGYGGQEPQGVVPGRIQYQGFGQGQTFEEYDTEQASLRQGGDRRYPG